MNDPGIPHQLLDLIAVATPVVDGRPVAVTGSQDRMAQVWDLTAPDPVGVPLKGPTGQVPAVALG